MDISTLNKTVNDAAGKAQKNEGLSALSFLISLAVYGSIFLPATYLFTILKDINHKVFQPRCLVDIDILPLPKGRVLWIKHIWELLKDDTKLIKKLGLDCYFFLRLLELAIKAFTPMTAIILPVLLPVNYTASSARIGGLDRFSISNIQRGQHTRWWITAFVSSLVHIYLWRLLIFEFKRVVKIRQDFLYGFSQARAVTTILVTEIPPQMWNVEDLRLVYSAYNGGPVDIILPKAGTCQSMENGLKNLYRDLDSLKQIDSDMSHTGYFHSDIGRFFRQLRREGILRWQIRNLRRDIERIKSIAIFYFSDLFTAHLLLQARASSSPMELEAHIVDANTVTSESVIYQNRYFRALWNIAMAISLNILAILWVVPISLTGLLSQLVYLDCISSSLSGLSVYQLGAIQGLAPQVAASILMYSFPVILQFVTKYYLVFEHLSVEIFLQRHYFIFLFTQLFLVVSISSSVTTMIPEIANDIQSVPSVLAKNLPKASNYFYSYLLLQAITQSVMVLFQLPGSLWACMQQRWKENSPRTVRWSLLYPVFTNLICICIIFSVISPLILLIGTVVFGVFLVVHSYQAIYVHETEKDTAGMLYWESLNQLFVGIYTMDLFLIGIFVLGNALGPSVVAAVLLVASALVHNHVRTRLHSLVKFASTSRCV
ncbi:putative DUF221 membrane protein [Aspergillus alliaceus]|uniref:putative DUF221 membrane protein n=1 Tax=Petromyces alliaceus TaxID=209559 RepID=UPI0012A6BB9B|nr:uncharacterized protein BDW43DRAFT_304278 [Aspergillus alliaceus]KAB8227890.1 hypothetical protein BDW43DRAFT_304278 [Aspergillus alliaceus]